MMRACTQGKGCPLHGHRVQILLTLEHGTMVHQQLLRPDELVMSLTCFIELARRAGWTVTPPDRALAGTQHDSPADGGLHHA